MQFNKYLICVVVVFLFFLLLFLCVCVFSRFSLVVVGGDVPTCECKAACKCSQKMQNMSPTATGLSNSESTQKIVQIPCVKSEKGIRKVCFMNDLLFHKNFGPNAHVDFLVII